MKRIIITEEEKERILDMHKSAILSEQPNPNVMAGIRQDQRQARQDLRAQQKDVRQDVRQARQDIRQDARQAAQDQRQAARAERQDARQDARDERQAQRKENREAMLAKLELAKTQMKANMAARKEARQDKRQTKEIQADIEAFKKSLGELQKALQTNPDQKDYYNGLIQTYQTAISNLSASLQSKEGTPPAQ